MPSLLRRHQHDAPTTSHRGLAFLLLLTSVLACIGTPVQHSLLTNAIAWSVICIHATLRLRGQKTGGGEGSVAQPLSWCAGGLLALGQLCQRTAEGTGLLWANALLPALVYSSLRSEIVNIGSGPGSRPPSPDKSRSPQRSNATGQRTAVVLLTCSAIAATFSAYGSIGSVALGLSYGVVVALAILLIEKAGLEARQSGAGAFPHSVNGLLAQPPQSPRPSLDSGVTVMKHVSLAAASATAVSALTLENFTFGGLAYYGVIGQLLGRKWLLWQGMLGAVFAVIVVSVHVVLFWSLLTVIQRRGSSSTSYIPFWAAIVSQLVMDPSIGRAWFAALCAAWTFVTVERRDNVSGALPRQAGFNRIVTLVALVSFLALSVLHFREPYERAKATLAPKQPFSEVLKPLPPVEPLEPMAFENLHEHPITQLVRDADASWQETVRGQSQSLGAAVVEYRRRYGIPPPPYFDKWYEFAKRKNVQLIDEFDTVYKTMLPFWGVSPATIRARAREAIGYADNMLMGLALRDGKPSVVAGGPDWLQQAAVGMMDDFVQYLPDMDLAFNVHDEPRVVVPHDDLSRLVQIALNKNMPVAEGNPAPRNSFSARPEDVNDGRRFAECRTTRFNWYAHQPVWDPSRLSCAPDTPARSLDESLAADNLTAYALSELGFVYNQTAFSDICNSPSFSQRFGFFDRPNAFNTVHDLFPIFSQSKISSFQDILYPSPWYWFGKVSYQEWKDIEYKAKIPSLLWRGSTTGGYSRDGGWRRQHRQHMVQKLNALDDAKLLQKIEPSTPDDETVGYEIISVPRQDYKERMDVHFSHVGQCDAGDCAAQREFFEIASGIDQQDHWKWRFLLDMDGNAFSGRFYAFLKSKSLVFKMSIFREWHQEWLRPWVHYVPLSLRGEEVLEGVRFFSAQTEEGGRELGAKVAEQGRDWAHKVLRNEDFEVWLFRLLLEYGRVIDDNRAEIGYGGP